MSNSPSVSSLEASREATSRSLLQQAAANTDFNTSFTTKSDCLTRLSVFDIYRQEPLERIIETCGGVPAVAKALESQEEKLFSRIGLAYSDFQSLYYQISGVELHQGTSSRGTNSEASAVAVAAKTTKDDALTGNLHQQEMHMTLAIFLTKRLQAKNSELTASVTSLSQLLQAYDTESQAGP